jgi:hypothetical protein
MRPNRLLPRHKVTFENTVPSATLSQGDCLFLLISVLITLQVMVHAIMSATMSHVHSWTDSYMAARSLTTITLHGFLFPHILGKYLPSLLYFETKNMFICSHAVIISSCESP